MHLFVLILFMTSLISQNQKFIRYPNLSSTGELLSFSYMGDIWVSKSDGSDAQRLTSHKGYDYKPLFSPDDSKIAFISDREGNDNIYVIHRDGTQLKRLTYYNGGDHLISWSSDGKSLIFISKRYDRYHWLSNIYSVSIDGGTPQKYSDVFAIDGAERNDMLYYVSGYNHKWRKNYRGSANNEIHQLNTKNKVVNDLTNHDGNDLFPMPHENILYYVTDKSGIFNIHRLDLTNQSDQQLTQFKDDGIHFASMAFIGNKIVFNHYINTYILDLTNNKISQLEFNLAEDNNEVDDFEEIFSSKISEMELAPNDKEIAIVYYGEIYAFKADDKKNGRISRLTTSSARERDIIWAKESNAIYYLSDKNGNYDVYKISPKEKNKPFYLNKYFIEEQISNSNESEYLLKISPDGKSLSFRRGNGDLIVHNLASKAEKTIIKGWNLEDYSWSPDSKWIAYSKDDANFNSDIHIIPANGGNSVNISQHPDNDFSPIWSKDGKKLAFASRRFNNDYDVILVYLNEVDANKTKDDWELEDELKGKKTESETKDEDKNANKSKDKKNKKESDLVVTIDFENIHMRLKRITNSIGNEFPLLFSQDAKKIIYSKSLDSSSDLYITDEWDRKEENLTDGNTGGSSVQFDSKYKLIYFKDKNGKVSSINDNGKDKKNYAYSGKFTNVKSAERMQVFKEIWRVQNENFYDPNFHGVQWNLMLGKYERYVNASKTERDFNDAMNMLLGELNASHQRYSSPPQSSAQYGNIGALISTQSNGVKIEAILRNGPLYKLKEKVKVGDLITQVDGENFSNFYQTMKDKVGQLVDLTIKRSQTEFTIQIRPESHFRVTNELAYDDWIEKNKVITHEKSKNKLAYVHIKGMNIPSLEEFETQLFSEAEGKDALIIDVRFNGGGFTTDYLLHILTMPEHAYTIPRNGGKGYPQDRRTFYKWTKPIIVLCNEFSYSNAEIFSHAIKVLKRGKVIGTQTFGAVISTGGQSLMNGGFVRMPFRGWYVEGSNLNQENNGAIPDIEVKVSQNDLLNNKDPQLEKAIELFLKNEM